MDLYIIRHAWAGQRDDAKWPDDSKRPLTAKGKKRFADMAQILVGRGVEPTLIATSPMVRCRQTAEILADQLSGDVEIVEQKELLPEGDIENLFRWTAEQARHNREIAWVGHSPQVNEYVARLVGLAENSLDLRKGAAVSISFADKLSPSQGELRWLVTAKILGV